MSTALSTPVPPSPSATNLSVRFGAVAIVALALDLLTKQWATGALDQGAIVISNWFSFILVFNTGAAGGVSLGPYTWLINVIGTALTIALVASVVVPLTRVDRRAIVAMGLIAGGAAGNLASLVVEPRGVPDFLGMQIPGAVVVFNLADVALWGGALVLTPIVVSLVRAVRAERRQAVLPQAAA